MAQLTRQSKAVLCGMGQSERGRVAMRTSSSFFRRWLLVPSIMVCIHSALVVLVAVSVATSSDSEAVMAWYLPYCIDYPAVLLLKALQIQIEERQLPIFFLTLGVIYWGAIGILIQSAWRWRTSSSIPISVLPPYGTSPPRRFGPEIQ